MGATWHYRIQAFNGLGVANSNTDSATLDDLIVRPPANLVATALDDDQVQLTWTPAIDAPGGSTYTIERALDVFGVPGTFAAVATGVASSPRTISGHDPNTTYWYRAKLVKAGLADGPYSRLRSATTFVAIPGTPSVPSLTLQGGPQVLVDWSAGSPDTATTYRVLRRGRVIGAGTWDHEDFDWGANTTTAPDTDLVDGTVLEGWDYQYRARGENGSGSSLYSAYSSSVQVCVAIGQVTGVSVSTSGVSDPTSELRVTWSTPAGTITTYRIRWRVKDSAGAFSEATDPSSPYDITGLTDGEEYEAQVRGEGPCGVGAYSTLAFGETDSDAPAQVTGLTVTPAAATDDTLDLDWNAALDATEYEVDRAPDSGGAPGTWANIATGVIATDYQDTGRSPNTKYWYRVRALNGAVPGPYSTAVAGTTHLQSPASFNAVHDVGACPTIEVDLSWSNLNGASTARSEQMRLQRSNDGGSTWLPTTPITISAGQTTYTDTGASTSTNRYRIRYESETAWTEDPLFIACPD